MKINLDTKNNLKSLFSFCLVFIFLVFYSNLKTLSALTMSDNQREIVEELRLIIPSKFKEEWLDAEKMIWEPWLSKKEGYLGRQIFWDKETEQALILVNWENKKLWKNISMLEVNEVQEKFDEKVKRSLKLDENPFKLIYVGELYKQR